MTLCRLLPGAPGAIGVRNESGESCTGRPLPTRPPKRKASAMKVRVHVSLKPGVLDPQGRAIHHSLEGLGFQGVNEVRAGRLIELDVDNSVSDEALDDMCRKLLANMVIENYQVERIAA